MIKKGLMVITVILLAVVIGGILVSECNTSEGVVTEKAVLYIKGPDSIEVGQSANYTLSFEGTLCYTGFPEIIWKSKEGQIVSQDGNKINFVAQQLGEAELIAEFGGMTTQKRVQVCPKASISLDMETWIHPGQWYSTGVEFSGVEEPELQLYKILETGRRVAVSSAIWESYGAEEIVIHESGNYVLVAEGFALSDGRSVVAEKVLAVTPYIQRGYCQFSWDDENLVQLTPADKVAIQFFLEEELGVKVDFSEGHLRDINRVFSSDFVFYKDNTRKDTIIYQDVFSQETFSTRKMWQTSAKAEDQRYYYLNWDDFFVLVKMGTPAASFVSEGSDSSDSSGGDSTTPPSPPPSGPSPRPPI